VAGLDREEIFCVRAKALPVVTAVRRGLFSIHTKHGLLNRRPKWVFFFFD
jgi:hypothetical protein